MKFIIEPSILSANTWHWKPSTLASMRLRREQTTVAEVSEYVKQIGFELSYYGKYDVTGTCDFEGQPCEVAFSYSETSSKVIKSLQIWFGGKKSNIKLLRKIAQQADDLKYIDQEIEHFATAGAIIPSLDRRAEFLDLLIKYKDVLSAHQRMELRIMARWHGDMASEPAQKPKI